MTSSVIFPVKPTRPPLPMMNAPAMTPFLPASIDNVNKQAKIQANEYKKQDKRRGSDVIVEWVVTSSWRGSDVIVEGYSRRVNSDVIVEGVVTKG